jgi:hypothetical protein
MCQSCELWIDVIYGWVPIVFLRPSSPYRLQNFLSALWLSPVWDDFYHAIHSLWVYHRLTMILGFCRALELPSFLSVFNMPDGYYPAQHAFDLQRCIKRYPCI